MILIPIALFAVLAAVVPNSNIAKNIIVTIVNVTLFTVVPEYNMLTDSLIVGAASIMAMWFMLRIALNHMPCGALLQLRSFAWRNRYFALSFAVGGHIAEIH
jgi:hypothetical protein